ncbi:adenosylcobalamin-dependent ribonucleoside-diphosphate reductase [Candidatus Pacearchaeota archaeon]|nr:adenosylcobalamin-dependent ribonucleoside-diphosphate reductase [Candidatus Pacearchaeota archaeon]
MEVEEYYNDYKLGIDIWKNKYRDGKETFEDFLRRVSNSDSDIKHLMLEKSFMFGGRILANRGIDKKVSYSNCYFLPQPKDSLDSIYGVAGNLAKVYSAGGGAGIDLSLLAPRGAQINNAAKITSGAVSFAELYNTTTALIGQDGRRGALMLSLDDSHLDLEEFITVKSEDGVLEKANLSVKFHDDFMQNAIDRKDVTHTYSRRGNTISKTVNPNNILHLLAEQAWDWSEPGALFWDTVQSWNAMSEYDDFVLKGVNPCGEVPLPEGGACLLGSMVLCNFVKGNSFMYTEFEDGVRKAVRSLNDVLDEGIKRHPLELQSDIAEKFRQIGLGVMGYADMLIKMELVYGRQRALSLTENVAKFMCDKAFNESALLAKEFGPFPGYDRDSTLASEFIKANVSSETYVLIMKHGLRNATILSIAPTGTLSTMLDISGGIEPIYALEYNRRTESLHGEDVTYKVRPHIVSEYMEANGIDKVEDLPDWFITAKNIDSLDRINTQAAWQYSIDSSISSTLNLPNNATPEDVYNIYINAWQHGLKGITVHREGNKR